MVFVPLHWTDRFASKARIDAVIPPETDPVSGQPETKAAVVSVAPFEAAWYGFAVTRADEPTLDTAYWARARVEGGHRIELADTTPLEDPATLAEKLFGASETVVVRDDARRRVHIAAVRDGAIVGLLFVAARPVRVSRDWIVTRFAAPRLDAAEAVDLLAGRPAGAKADPGRRVCSCFGIGVNQIRAAAAEGATTVDAIGERLKAGTNCGSCRPEIARVLAEVANAGKAEAAE